MGGAPYKQTLLDARPTLTVVVTRRESLYKLFAGALLSVTLMFPFGAVSVSLAFTLAALFCVELIERPARQRHISALRLSWVTPALSLTRGQRARLELLVVNPTARRFESLAICVRGPDGARERRALCLEPGERLTLCYELEARWVGPWRLWGVELEWRPGLALRFLRLQRPLPLLATVDFGPAPLPAPLLTGRALTVGDASAVTPYQEEGDFQELRPYLPGDERRRVAWRASARAGELLSRLYELPRRQRVLLAVDVGSLMREEGAEGGGRPLDSALDAAARYLRACRDVPVGLALFDHRLLGAAAPAVARPERALELLRYATRVVDLDCLDADEALLCAQLGDALAWRGVSGVRFGAEREVVYPSRAARLRVIESLYWTNVLSERLAAHGDDLHAQLPAAHIPAAPAAPAAPSALTPDERDARDAAARLLALACSAEGLHLPFKKSRAPSERAVGLADLAALAARHEITDLVVMSRAAGLTRSSLAPLAAWQGRGGGLLWLEVGDQRDAREALSALAPLAAARGAFEVGVLGGLGRGGERGSERTGSLCGARLSCVP